MTGVLQATAKAYMEHVQALACDHSGAMAGTHTSCPEALALTAALAPLGPPDERGEGSPWRNGQPFKHRFDPVVLDECRTCGHDNTPVFHSRGAL